MMTMRDGWVWRVLGALLAAVPVRGADVDPAEVEKMMAQYGFQSVRQVRPPEEVPTGV